MIDPKELRIGNWINAYHNDVQVTSINSEPDHLSLQISTTPTLVGSTHGGMYFPIPLTEEWLIKIGFENHSPGLYRIKIHRNQKRYLETVLSFNRIWDFSIIIDWNIEPDTEVWIRGLSAVHQLQNLYHSLTGEELTIKE